MTLRSALLGTAAVAVFASTVAAVSLVGTGPALAQATANPTMTNVVPDAGTFAVAGKIQAIDPAARTLTIAPFRASRWR